MIAGPGGALVNVTGVTAGRLPGFYHIDVVPIRKETWKKGVYIFAVAVERKADKGQTLATVLMDGRSPPRGCQRSKIVAH